MYTETEQQTLDIDCFFTDGKHIGFVTSGAGKLPETVAGSAEGNKQYLISETYPKHRILSLILF